MANTPCRAAFPDSRCRPLRSSRPEGHRFRRRPDCHGADHEPWRGTDPTLPAPQLSETANDSTSRLSCDLTLLTPLRFDNARSAMAEHDAFELNAGVRCEVDGPILSRIHPDSNPFERPEFAFDLHSRDGLDRKHGLEQTPVALFRL